MTLPVNTLLKERDSGRIFRVLDEVSSRETKDPTSTHYILIDVDLNALGVLPTYESKHKTLCRIADNELVVIDEVFPPVNLSALKKKK